jgi:hypothetical protein
MRSDYGSYWSYLKSVYFLWWVCWIVFMSVYLALRFAVPIATTDLMIEGVVCVETI